MHDKALTKRAADIFPDFAGFKGFYLAGGTALALQIGHRRSVDFDFFSSEKLPVDLMAQVKKVFSGSDIAVTYSAVNQLNLMIDDIKTTFLEYPYPLFDNLVEYKGISVASVGEIAAMKAYVLGRRLSFKDYVDWYFLLKEQRVKLYEVILMSKKKFGSEFNDRLFLGQLVSLEDIPDQPIDFLRGEVDRKTILEFLESEVRGIGF